ncbi:MAG: methyltransferase domain-containing protein [Caldilineaceae bacterium]
MKDFTAITETPGSGLNQEQMARITQRYHLGAALAQGKDVLEVACGAGIGLGVLQQAARSLVGCDYTLPVLQMARAHYGSRVPLVGADAQQLPFADQSFDLVLSFEAIYYLNRLDWFLREAHRTLRREGNLLICTSNPGWPHFVAGQMSVHYPSLPEIAEQLSSAGFQQVQAYGALPIQGESWRRSVITALRKQVLQQEFFSIPPTIIHRFTRLVYGQLTPLPAALPFPSPPTIHHAYCGLTALAPHETDQIHRVLFLVASKPVA